MPYYFDHNATTPVDPLVLTAFMEAASDLCGNASSIHYFGQSAKQRLESARGGVARMVGASPREIVFTSGGTESDNLALFGAVRASSHRSSKGRKHVVTTAIEHSAVLGPCGRLAKEDVDVTLVPVGASGVVDPDDIRRAILPGTVLISVMHANNETGAIQPLAEISALARETGILLHSDGVQGAARLPVSMNEPRMDLYSFSAHKMNGLKGTGALFVREKTPFHAILFGGHQERERRPGTENVAGAVAFAAAAALPRVDVSALRDRLEQGILALAPSARVNAGASPRLPNTSNILFPGLSGEGMVIALDLDGFAVSSGSACASGSVEAPHVLLAMGLSETEARSSVRFSLGAGNTIQQVDALIEAVGRVTARARRRELAHV